MMIIIALFILFYEEFQICDKPRPERVNRYCNHPKLFKYAETDMPMKIDKIIHFEKRNQLQINVFGIEESSMYLLHALSNRSNAGHSW